MYKDDLWYNKLSRAVEAHKEGFTDKQVRRYGIDLMLRIADQVRQQAESCGVCRGYEHNLTRLEEEMTELPGSKAQRQWQAKQLREMGTHFAREHDLAPPTYYTWEGLRYGGAIGVGVGLVLGVVLGELLLLLPLGGLLGSAAGWGYGMLRDSAMKQKGRVL